MIKVVLLIGGKSSEHEISLKSSYFIFNTLDRSKYEVTPILIDKKGNWIIPESKDAKYPNIQSIQKTFPIESLADEFKKQFIAENQILHSEGISISDIDCDIAFLGLHGGDGENGVIQAFLQMYSIPFTGSGVLASALAMDKERSNYLFLSAGLTVANFVNVNKKEFSLKGEGFLNNFHLTFPVFIKPTHGGSSVGVGKANNILEVATKLRELFNTEESVLIQENISGIEVSCGVLEKKTGRDFEVIALHPTEIVPKSEFFDYKAKYQIGHSEEITPARISDELTASIRESALLAHKILGCKGYSRTDFIIQDGKPYILETNTLPGMTETSLIPQQAKYAGFQMNEVFDWLIENGLSLH
ncbi:MAG TPA: D-alanine--D-alanine ligase [Leptospiraceae bacterium]|nr:D-alanine--D-alanine ligase [Leptospiraceae bacterium]HMX34522.1 D-alanine--D-alanine ligase [Leptospiraceae bacterium]HMY33065.1 D-alanine--D-alanine ligase [Leptospiraceae bacterium]HMZ66708.1 D-alanine--D-alanine ligase [Leptospiraceae bacterium]HNA09162.1 D-alanine--D-alanine ligase [Leptospiraceae bacterium]